MVDRQRGGAKGLPYWPALDGLRGLAVAAVLLFHAHPRWLPGGFLGVSLFFTLSGFLITSLALAEHGATGRVGMRAFWVRRVRRLVPASLMALVLALAVTFTALPVHQRVDAIGDVRAALLNVANWRFIVQGAPYAALDRVPSPVQHYWSLAIEEQLYLVFPVVAALALRWRARGLGIALAVLAAGSLASQLVVDGRDRVYFGTDTRAAELAVGGLVALALPRLRQLLGRQLVGVATVGGIVGLVATLVLWAGTEQQAAGLYRGGLAMTSVVSAMLILGAVAAADRRPLVLLTLRPLVALGRISYGVYLYHFPLFLLLTEARTGLSGPELLIVRCVATIVLAAASFRLVEMPIRTGRTPVRGRPLLRRRPLSALAGAAAALALLTLPAAQLAERHGVDAGVLASGVVVDPATPLLPPAGPEPAGAPPTTAPAEAVDGGSIDGGSIDGGSIDGGDPSGAVVPAPGVVAPPRALRAPRVLFVGDSTAAAAGDGLQEWGRRTGRLEATTVSAPGCALLHGPRYKVRDGYTYEPKGCAALIPTAVAEAQQRDVDAIVVFVGSLQLSDWELEGLDGWQHFGKGDFDERYEVALRSAAQELTRAGVPVLWADVPVPEWDLERFGEIHRTPIPGAGPASANDPARAARLDSIDARVLPGLSIVQRWAYAAALADQDGTISERTRPDGLHVSGEGMAQAADRGMYEVMGNAYRSVVARAPAGLRAPSAHMWSALAG